MNGIDDGGSVEQFTETEIEAVIDHYDDPAHPDALTLETAREHLLEIETVIETEWDERMRELRAGGLDVAADLGRLVVFRDTERRLWDRLLDEIELYDSVARTIVRIVHHQAGTRLTESSFDGSDAIVAEKPDRAADGQALVESIVASLANRGVSIGDAWAYYGIEIGARDASEWLEYGGYDDKLALADAVERARDQLR